MGDTQTNAEGVLPLRLRSQPQNRMSKPTSSSHPTPQLILHRQTPLRRCDQKRRYVQMHVGPMSPRPNTPHIRSSLVWFQGACHTIEPVETMRPPDPALVRQEFYEEN